MLNKCWHSNDSLQLLLFWPKIKSYNCIMYVLPDFSFTFLRCYKTKMARILQTWDYFHCCGFIKWHGPLRHQWTSGLHASCEYWRHCDKLSLWEVSEKPASCACWAESIQTWLMEGKVHQVRLGKPTPERFTMQVCWAYFSSTSRCPILWLPWKKNCLRPHQHSW